jgi:hypothetical protein
LRNAFFVSEDGGFGGGLKIPLISDVAGKFLFLTEYGFEMSSLCLDFFQGTVGG